MDNKVTISGCPSKFLVVRTWSKENGVSQLGHGNLWLSIRQPHKYFWLSSDFFVCPGCTDNHNFERCKYPKSKFRLTLNTKCGAFLPHKVKMQFVHFRLHTRVLTSTFFWLGKFLKKLADNQCSLNKDIQHFSMEVD